MQLVATPLAVATSAFFRKNHKITFEKGVVYVSSDLMDRGKSQNHIGGTMKNTSAVLNLETFAKQTDENLDLSVLTTACLMNNLDLAVMNEKKATHEVLRYIHEITARKLHLELG